MGAVGQLPSRRPSRYASVRAAAAFAALLAAGASVAEAQAPGGVSDPNAFLIWLKANTGTSTTTDNAPVVTWSDQSPVHGNNDASQTISNNSRPLFRSNTGNLINFNPVISFDSNNDYLRVFLDVSPPNRNLLSTAIVYRPTRAAGCTATTIPAGISPTTPATSPATTATCRIRAGTPLASRSSTAPSSTTPRSTGPPSSSTTGRWRTSPTTTPRTPTATSTSG